MQCTWCGGNGKHLGTEADVQSCEHCLGFGAAADPPGTPLRQVLSEDACSDLCETFICRPADANRSADAFASWLRSFVQSVAQQSSGRRLPEQLEMSLAEYWLNPVRDETLGEFIQRIAQCALDQELV